MPRPGRNCNFLEKKSPDWRWRTRVAPTLQGAVGAHQCSQGARRDEALRSPASPWKSNHHHNALRRCASISINATLSRKNFWLAPKRVDDELRRIYEAPSIYDLLPGACVASLLSATPRTLATLMDRAAVLPVRKTAIFLQKNTVIHMTAACRGHTYIMAQNSRQEMAMLTTG